MTWSLLLQNGDLFVDGNQLAQVTGSQKLFQDLMCAILEPMGTDDLHPDYGSQIDGGTYQGASYPSAIGRIDAFAELEVRSEIQRIIQYYQARQLVRAQSDKQTYGKTTLTLGEVIASVSTPQLTKYIDSLTVSIDISTMAETNLTVQANFI